MKKVARVSRTQFALSLYRDGNSIYGAAKHAGLSYSTVHAAVQKMKEKEARGVCPHCGQLMPKYPDGRLRRTATK